jgi:hypothetical protein
LLQCAANSDTRTLALVEAELGEATCGTMACTAQNSCTDHNIGQCLHSSALALVSYGSPSCPKQFVAEDTNMTLVGRRRTRVSGPGSHCALTSPTVKPFVVPSANLKAVRATVSAILAGVQQQVEVGFWHLC